MPVGLLAVVFFMGSLAFREVVFLAAQHHQAKPPVIAVAVPVVTVAENDQASADDEEVCGPHIACESNQD